MNTLSTALLIGLGGSFAVVWITNIMGARLEAYFQRVSLIWAQWPQRVFMTVGIIAFSLIAINYYSINTYGRDIFVMLEDLPLIKELADPARWFFRQLGSDVRTTWGIITEAPENTPLIFILFIVMMEWIFMSIFEAGLIQKLIVTIVTVIVLGFLFQDNFSEGTPRTLDLYDITYQMEELPESIWGLKTKAFLS